MSSPLPYRNDAQNDKRNQRSELQGLDNLVQSIPPIAECRPLSGGTTLGYRVSG
jgi:hypothetical protein